jgi:hypothetical protein
VFAEYEFVGFFAFSSAFIFLYRCLQKFGQYPRVPRKAHGLSATSSFFEHFC